MARKKHGHVLEQMQSSAEAGRLILPDHVLDAMDDDDLLAVDIENAILTGGIVERQWDYEWEEWKYVIQGQATDGNEIEVVAKPGYNNATILITVYRV